MRRTTRRTTGKATELVIRRKQGTTLQASDKELAFLEVVALDSRGNEVPDFNEWVEVELPASGTLVATDNGNPTDLTPFQSSRRKAYNGKLLIIVQGDKNDDSIAVSVHADGLKSGSMALIVE